MKKINVLNLNSEQRITKDSTWHCTYFLLSIIKYCILKWVNFSLDTYKTLLHKECYYLLLEITIYIIEESWL